MNTLPIEELRALLAAVSAHGDRHLLEIETDLQQTGFLLDEAIEKLSASFMQVYSELSQQQAAIGLLAEAGRLQPEEMQQLQVYQDRIGDEINKVVTGMQFQDMTNQLLQRTIRRVNGLKDLLQELSSHQFPMSARDEHSEIRQFIRHLNAHFDQSSQHLSGHLRKAVHQQDMATGDIDLF
ncbi:MAG TPA: chemotaxis protein [Methylophilus sp.]